MRVIQQEGVTDPLGYFVMVPYDKGLAECCLSLDERVNLDPSEMDGPISQDHAYVPAAHFASHEFEEESDQDVATAASAPGMGAAAIPASVEPTIYSETELDHAIARRHLARTELRRRGYSVAQVDGVMSGDIWPG